MSARHLIPALVLLGACATTRPAPAPVEPAAVETETAPDPSVPVAVPAVPLEPTAPLQTVLLHNAQTPLVTFRLVFRTGSVDDPVGKEGLTTVTADLLAEGGTRSLSASPRLEAR